jgi:hypothetical protein
MSGFKDKGFGDRLSAAKDAKKAMAAKFLDKPAADDPEMIARREERMRIAAEREARLKARKDERAAEKEKAAADAEARIKAEADEKAELEERTAREAETREQDAKAARDARYAARKARNK